MKKRIILAICSLMIMGGGIGMTSIHQEELPVSEELLAEAMAEPEEEVEKMAEVKLCLEGCTLEEGHEGDCVLPPKEEDTLTHYITTVERNNKSYASATPKEGALKSILKYRVIAHGDNYHLLEIQLITGRKHQIRVQLSAIGCPIKGDLKYGAKRSNPDGSISLQAHNIRFVHPVSKQPIDVTAPVPDDALWQALAQKIE